MVDLTPAKTGTSFGDELRRIRTTRSLSLRQLARMVHYTPGHLSKVETGRKVPTVQLALRCDEVLDTGGRLMALRGDDGLPSPALLPSASAAFVGRAAELRQLVTAVAGGGRSGSPCVVEVTGPPGVGKSALALRLAHEVAPHFTAGQLYADLARRGPGDRPYTVHDILWDFLTALGVRPSIIPSDPEQRITLYRSTVARRRILVLLDNVSGPEQIMPLLPSSGDCAVVVTSRRRLDSLELRHDQRVPLGPLGEDESVALLRLLIGPERTAEESGVLERVAAYCEYLPLALRIAGERVATRPNYSAHHLAADLATASNRLDVLRSAGLLTVRGSFSWSYEALDADAARLFRLLSTYWGGPVPVDAAAAVGGLSATRARALLDALVQAHLLKNVGGNQYTFHELLRAFAEERAVAEESQDALTAARRRALDWFVRTAHAATELLTPAWPPAPVLGPPLASATRFADRRDALDWCEEQTPNLVTVTRTAVEIGDYAASWKAPVAFAGFLYLRRQWRVWIVAHQIGAVGARETQDRYGEACLLHNLGFAYVEERRFDEARSHLHRALALRREIGDRIGEAWTLTLMGFLYRALLRPEEAVAHFRLAAQVFGAQGRPESGRMALAGLGDVLRTTRRHDEALEQLRTALQNAWAVGDRQTAGFVLSCLGTTYQELGRLDEALGCLDQALTILREHDDRWGEASVLQHRGRLLHEIGDLDLARGAWKQALAVFEALGSPQAEEIRSQLWGIDLFERICRTRRGIW
ncbi:tetratricopeptide repeat protein [Streptomyces lincolnensis]|nr:tetratricopeptide repeat protein [Streptomyces lincolnensis]